MRNAPSFDYRSYKGAGRLDHDTREMYERRQGDDHTMAKTKLTAGEVAPQFTLRAIGSGRQVGPATVGGAALLLVFHDQNSVEQVQTMQEAVRARCPDASRLLVASVVNMLSLIHISEPTRPY